MVLARMTTRRAALAVLALTVACGVAAGADASPSARHRGCRHDGRTLAHSNEARVFRVGARVYGCSRRVGRNWLLAAPDEWGPESLTHAVAAGRYAAYRFQADSAASSGYSSITLVDLRSHFLRQVGPASLGDDYSNFAGKLFKLVVTAGGTAAWTAQAFPTPERQWPYEVRTVHLSDPDRTLDSGAGLDPRSLRLSARTLTWTKDGSTQSAELD